MTDVQIEELTIAQAAGKVHAGELTPMALVEACLDQINATNPQLNAFLTVLADQAREEAAQATAALDRGENWGALHGIPLGVKDLVDVEGVKTTAGSHLLRNNVAGEDAIVIQQLRAAGAIIIGKTHLHEFAIGATNVNPHYGPARNPWNHELSPGGSSGGSAAAVAAGMCLGALGTDTGGSVRLPSAFTGLTGLRPAIGTISTMGVIPMSWALDTVGPMAHTAEDVAILYDALQTATQTRPRLNEPIKDLRLVLPDNDMFWQETELDIVQTVRNAVRLLEAAGMEVAEITLPDLKNVSRAGGVISLGDAADYHRNTLAETPEVFGDDVRARLEWGAAKSAPDYARARHTMDRWQDQFKWLFRNQCDVLALPTVPVSSHRIVQSEDLSAARELLSFTYPISLTGMPALSIPCGFTADGLPIGLQLVSVDSARLLNVAHFYQQHTDWHARRPDLKFGGEGST